MDSMVAYAGQWIGTLSGDHDGIVLLDLDHRKQWLEGSIYGFLNGEDTPSVFRSIVVSPIENTLSFEFSPIPLHPKLPRAASSHEYSEENFPKKVNVSLSLTVDGADGTWSTDNDLAGELRLTKSRAHQPSNLIPEPSVGNWADFQSTISEFTDVPYKYVFRGQPYPWRLRTAFHRTRRKDLVRYWEDDVHRVRKASIGILGNSFDHGNPDHNGAFLHLLQHFGYPTPMLDWTYSPFIAAYFAYSSLLDNSKYRGSSGENIRIFMFDVLSWQLDFNQVLNLTHCRPHFSFLEPMSIENTRALPQQAIASMTNIDDIESYILFRENQTEKKYLRVFDLPQDEYEVVLRQLGLMGISPGSLFPGLEGLCAEYRNRQFGYYP